MSGSNKKWLIPAAMTLGLTYGLTWVAHRAYKKTQPYLKERENISETKQVQIPNISSKAPEKSKWIPQLINDSEMEEAILEQAEIEEYSPGRYFVK